MKTLQDLKNTINNLKSDLIEIGVDPIDMSVSISEASFGNSVYLYVRGVKVRCSDHSTGLHRIMSEINICDRNYASVLYDLEVLFFNERFEKVVTLGYAQSEERTEKAMKSCTYEYIIHGERVGKRGNKIYEVSLKKQEITTYVRI